MINWKSKICALLTIVFLSLSTFASATSAMYPMIKRDSNGNAVAVWVETVNDLINIKANTYINGTWGSPDTLFSGGTVTQTPVFGVSPVDSDEIAAVVVWADTGLTETEQESTALFSVMLETSSGSWSSVNQIFLDEDESVNSDYEIRTSDDGTAVLIYTIFNSQNSNQPVRSTSATIDSNNTWSTPAIISNS